MSIAEVLALYPPVPEHPGAWSVWHARIAQGLTAADAQALHTAKLLSKRRVASLFPTAAQGAELSREDANTFYRTLQVLTTRARHESASSLDARLLKAAAWLEAPNKALKGAIPGDLLSTPHGSEYALTAAQR